MKLGEALLAVSRRESVAGESDHGAESRRVKLSERARERVENVMKRGRGKRDPEMMPLHGVRAQAALRALHTATPRQAVVPKLRGAR